jgi:hypothetical protein
VRRVSGLCVMSVCMALAAFRASPLSAQTADDPMLDDTEDDVEVGTEPMGEEGSGGEDPQALQGELSLSNSELRARFRQGVTLGVGQMIAPWQQYALAWHSQKGSDHAMTFQLGGGLFKTLRSKDGLTYTISSRTVMPTLGWRFYPSETVSMFLEGLAGAGYWRGSLDPSGGASHDLPARSPFSAQGVFIGGTVGFASLWENGFYLEYQFIGTSMARVLSNTAEGKARGYIDDEIKAPSSWGLVNIKAGWFF